MKSLFSQEDAMRDYGNEMKREGQTNEQHRVALNMNAEGIPVSTIAKVLGLPADTIQTWLARKVTS